MTRIVYKHYEQRLYLDKEQSKAIDRYMGCSRFVYNYFLAYYKEAFEKEGKRWDVYEASRMLTELKKKRGYQWLKRCSSSVLVCSLRDLDKDYKNFFKHRAGYPQFKSEYSKTKSITFALHQPTIDNQYKPGVGIRVPKVGMVEFDWSFSPKGVPKTVTISRNNRNQYFIHFSVAELE